MKIEMVNGNGSASGYGSGSGSGRAGSEGLCEHVRLLQAKFAFKLYSCIVQVNGLAISVGDRSNC